MYKRLLRLSDSKQSAFLFGPRGTGKTCWLRATYPNALYLDLLDSSLYLELKAAPEKLERFIPPNWNQPVIIDEVQKIPELLNEVHRLIENRGVQFILSGSSARGLKKGGANLLAGRALTYHMYPLTVQELGSDFSLEGSLQYGHLPAIYSVEDRKKFLKSYVQTYIQEEVAQEGLTRNLGAFSRFLEIASFSQGSLINMSEIAREIGVNRKVAEGYFSILEDILFATRLPIFMKRAKRRLVQHPKLYYFDVGVYRTLRPMGPFDSPEEVSGVALESLFYQEIRALNEYLGYEYTLYFWRTAAQQEIDFILYGPRGLLAFEIKRSSSISKQDLRSLLAFKEDYPEAKLFLLSGTKRAEFIDGISILPFVEALKELPNLLKNE